MIEGRDARIRRLYEDERLRANGPGRELIGVLLTPTGTSSAGYAYLERPAFERVRDWVPHVYQHGPGVLSALDTLLEVIQEHDAPSLESAKRAARVVRQIVRRAAG